MMKTFMVPEDDIGFWVGTVAAVFAIAQAFSGVLWGRASDYFGRKPVILTGLFFTMATSIIFGFSQSLAQAIVARSIGGFSSGTVGVIRTTVAEMVPQKELQPRAFSIMPLIWSVGSIIGPMFGGALAKPAETYPSLFGNSWLLKKFPYAFPNIVTSVFFVIGLSAGLLFFKETLETRKHKRDWGLVLGEMLTRPCSRKKRSPKWLRDDAPISPLKRRSSRTPVTPPKFMDIFTPQSTLNLLAYCILALHSIAFDNLIPVFLNHSPQADRAHNPKVTLPFKFAGGFGLDHQRIALIFTIYGVVVMLVQFIIFPPVARRYGVLRCLRLCTLTFPLAYFLAPFTVLFNNTNVAQIAMFGVMLIKAIGVVFAFPCVTIMLTNSALSLRLLGTLNGVSTSLSAIGRAIGPISAGGLFTLGNKIGFGILPWWVLGFIAIAGHISTYWLIEMEGFGGANDDSDEEEEGLEAQPLAGSNPDLADQAAATGVLEEDEHDSDHEDDEDDFAIEDAPLLADRRTPRSRQRKILTADAHTRVISSPVGIREPIGPGGRRLSNSLAHSNNGHGTAGTPFN